METQSVIPCVGNCLHACMTSWYWDFLCGASCKYEVGCMSSDVEVPHGLSRMLYTDPRWFLAVMSCESQKQSWERLLWQACGFVLGEGGICLVSLTRAATSGGGSHVGNSFSLDIPPETRFEHLWAAAVASFRNPGKYLTLAISFPYKNPDQNIYMLGSKCCPVPLSSGHETVISLGIFLFYYNITRRNQQN